MRSFLHVVTLSVLTGSKAICFASDTDKGTAETGAKKLKKINLNGHITFIQQVCFDYSAYIVAFEAML